MQWLVPQEPLNYGSGQTAPLPDQGSSGRGSQSNRRPAHTATPGVQLSCQDAGARSKRSPHRRELGGQVQAEPPRQLPAWLLASYQKAGERGHSEIPRFQGRIS